MNPTRQALSPTGTGHSLQRPQRLSRPPTQEPVPSQRIHQPLSQIQLLSGDSPIQCGPQIRQQSSSSRCNHLLCSPPYSAAEPSRQVTCSTTRWRCRTDSNSPAARSLSDAVRRHRLQQPVPRPVRPLHGYDERPVHEPNQHIENVRLLTAHTARGLRSTAIRMYGEPPQHGLLVRSEQLPAPVDHRQQSLLTRCGTSVPGRQQPEAVIESCHESTDSQGTHPGRGELQRQWDPVKPPAEHRHVGSRLRGQSEPA